MNGKIFVIEDDALFREYLKVALLKITRQVLFFPDGKSALDVLDKEKPDLVITDLRLPDISGIDILNKIKESDPMIQVIIMTAYADMSNVIQSMQLNAYDIVKKPFDMDKFLSIVQTAMESKKPDTGKTININEQKYDSNTEAILIGDSPSIYDLYKKIGRVSSNKVSVLIQGESGTGKELVAKIIHNSGITRNKPFIPVNCSALTETLLESELFGHVRGSFTDATRNKKGKFELAEDGTIFLDEISEISQNLQVKLLRVIQEKEFERVGGEAAVPMKARLIVATNKNLAELVNARKFREDLYFRLKVFSIEIPPLRKRKSDLPALVVHFLKKINAELGKNVYIIPYEVMELLENCDWVGNVRELENTLMQAVILANGNILEKEHIILGGLEPDNSKNNPNRDKKLSLAEIEKNHIKNVLDEVNWDKKEACKILGIAKATLYNKLETYGIKRLRGEEN
ncbi:MAG TPA: sigma-54 dependent transcriptional regulator [Ignavibacteriaceae bacterium]|nr:sigma-54 dependent transcriptional regulator [Ignavibacteriaceae bacterium]